MANPPSNFLKFAGTPFEKYILPIIPANAKLKPREDGKPGIDPERLGKIPGRYVVGAAAWVGFGNWPDHWTSKKDLEDWQNWQTPDFPIAIGMRTAEFPVVDIDSDDLAIVEAIHTLAWKHLGCSPVRCRRESHRRALCYKWTPGPKHDRAPVRKMRLAFTDKESKTHAVEVLGRGQQVVIEGPHAKGKMHYWLDGKGLIESHDQLVDITGLEASQFVRALEQWVEEQGFLNHHRQGEVRCRAKAKTTSSRPEIGHMTVEQHVQLGRELKALNTRPCRLISGRRSSTRVAKSLRKIIDDLPALMSTPCLSRIEKS